MGKPSSSPRTPLSPSLVVDYAVSSLVTIAAKVFSSLFMSLFFVMRVRRTLTGRLRGEKPEPAKREKRPEVVCTLQERFPGWAVYQSKESFAASKHTEKRIAAKISR